VEAELQTRRTPADSIAIGRSLTRPDAFSVIFDRHFRGVHRYLSRRVGRELADDLASATFTIAFERRRSFRTESDSAFPWLLGIATNLLRNHRRSEQRALEAVARLGETSVVFARELTGDDRDVAGALARLDPDQRDVLFLYVWAELSYDEIATTLGVPIGTVRSRLSRARSQMRSELSEPTAAGAREENR
jgi:RNA polymerase sigma factor (sigma-70 family)